MEEVDQANEIVRRTRNETYNFTIRCLYTLSNMYDDPDRDTLNMIRRDHKGNLYVELEKSAGTLELEDHAWDEPDEYTCNGTKSNGDPCQMTVDGPEGYCTYHEDQRAEA